MVKRLLIVALVLGLSAATMLAIERLIFAISMFDKCVLVSSSVRETDLTWWRDHVGPIPRGPQFVEQPPGFPGREANLLHRNGGDGSDGPSSSPVDAPSGIAAFDLKWDNPLVSGRALASTDRRAYLVGLSLPLPFLTRVFVGDATAEPNHPAELGGGWTTLFNHRAYLLDSGLLSVAVIVIWLCGRSIARLIRKPKPVN